MRKQLAVLVFASALAWADPAPHVTRNVVFHTSPPGASIVQLKPERGDVGTAENEMPVDIPLDGNNVSARPLDFEASMPGHKTLIFHMDTRGPTYNLDVNTPVEFTVIEKLEPDGSASAFADWLKNNPGLAGAIVATLLAGVGVAIYVVKARNAPPPAVAPQAPAGSYRDHEVESPIAPALIEPPKVVAAPEPPKGHRDFEVEPPAHVLAAATVKATPEPPRDYRDFEVEPPAHVLAAAAAPVVAEPPLPEPEPVAVEREPEPVEAATAEPAVEGPESEAEEVSVEASAEDMTDSSKGKPKRSKKAKAKPSVE